MKLVDLDPRWILKDGQRVGFTFIGPKYGSSPIYKDRPGWRAHNVCRQSCFLESPPSKEQWKLFAQSLVADGDDEDWPASMVQGCTPGTHWQIAGGIENASFETLTVTPSIDGSKGGQWHGFITNGEIVGGL